MGGFKMTQILNRWNGNVIVEGEMNLRELVLHAVNTGVSLNYASLDRASLDDASLDGASLDYASLNYASLDYASLNRASLNDASMDGASSWQMLRKVTLPLIAPSVTICTFLTLSNSFKLFDQNLSLTGGDPMRQTAMLALDIYDTFYGRTGYQGVGQAKAVIFFVLVGLIAFIQLRVSRSREVED